MIVKRINTRLLVKIGLPLIGGAAGYMYYYYIGCVSGTCPITSNPWISTLYGVITGFALTPFKKKLS